MSKKCTPLWCEAHLEVKSGEKKQRGSEHFWTFGRGFCVAGTRDSAPCQSQGCVSVQALHYTPLHYNYSYNYDYNYNCNCNYNHTTLHYTTPIALHYTTLNSTTRQAQLQLQLQLQLYYATPHYTNYTTLQCALHYTPLHFTTLHSITLQYTTTTTTATTTLLYTRLHYTTLHYIALHSLHHHKCNCKYTTQITPRHNYNSTTLLQLQLRYTTLHPAVVGEVTDPVTTATIVTTPK